MLPSSFGVYNSLSNLLWTCPVINMGLFTGAYLRMENTGDLVLYDGTGNVQWYQGEKLLKPFHLASHLSRHTSEFVDGLEDTIDDEDLGFANAGDEWDQETQT
jgi:hypothetical protein